MRSVVAIVAVCAVCVACDSSHPSAATSASVVAPKAPASAAPEPAPPTSAHAELDARGLVPNDATKGRKAVLAALVKAKTLLAQKKAKAALDALTAVRSDDPTGAALAALAAQAAKAAEDVSAATTWTLAASVFAQGDERIAKSLAATWAPGEAPSGPVPGKVLSAKDLMDGCEKVRDAARRLPLAYPVDSKLTCVQERTLEVGQPKLESVTGLRVDSSAGDVRQSLGWIALKVESETLLYGPVAYRVSLPERGATSDFVIDLQQVDVLSGGAPEIVVRIMERETSLDVALNELAKRDRTRVVLLSVDRGSVVASRELTLADTHGRDAIDTKDRATAPGWPRAKGLGKSTGFELKVAWGLPNEIRLTKQSGDATPPVDGTVTLFP
jgi:hypothetical protein